MVQKSLQDIHDVLQLSMPTAEIGQWLVAANDALGGARPIDCMTRNRFDEVYEVALAI